MSAGAWRDVRTYRDAALAGKGDQELQWSLMGSSQSQSCPIWSLGWRQTFSDRCLSQSGTTPIEESKTTWPGCPKGLGTLGASGPDETWDISERLSSSGFGGWCSGHHGAKLMRSQWGVPDPGQGRRWEELQVVVVEARDGCLPLACFGRGTYTSSSRTAAAKRPSVSHQRGCFHVAFMRFMMTVWFVAIYCSAGLSPLFISHGSRRTAVNHCKAGSLVSSHKFKCWKKRFVYSYASLLQMWLFIELHVPPRCEDVVW